MKFKQAVKILEVYDNFKDECYELAQIKTGYRNMGSIYEIELGIGGIVIRFEEYYCRERETHSVTLPPIAFDDKEAWLKQLEEDKQRERLERQELLRKANEKVKEQLRQEYEKLKKEFEE